MSTPTLRELSQDTKLALKKELYDNNLRLTDEEFERLIKVFFRSYRLIKLPEVRAMTTLSTSEIYRRIAAGTFPRQYLLGPKSAVWFERHIIDFVDDLQKI